jgi:hypothetical protein
MSGDRVAAEKVNSPPRQSNFSASPSPSAAVRSSPSPSPSPSVELPAEKTLATGTYQCEVNETFKSDAGEHAATIEVQLTLNSDGTYLEQGYITIHGTAIADRLSHEEKGIYVQTSGVLITKERLEREFDLETQSWSSWKTPSDGSESRDKLRNITPTTFQAYDNTKKVWRTFSKP